MAQSFVQQVSDAYSRTLLEHSRKDVYNLFRKAIDKAKTRAEDNKVPAEVHDELQRRYDLLVRTYKEFVYGNDVE